MPDPVPVVTAQPSNPRVGLAGVFRNSAPHLAVTTIYRPNPLMPSAGTWDVCVVVAHTYTGEATENMTKAVAEMIEHALAEDDVNYHGVPIKVTVIP
jgi:hypothetical protein